MRRPVPPTPRPHQDGQVMVITALMVLVMFAGIVVGLDIGHLVLARIQFQNGADAAALAAVAVKVDKHHFDTTWRWAMQQEAYMARMEQVRAKLIFAQAVLDAQKAKLTLPGVPVPMPGGGLPPIPPVPGPVPMPGPGVGQPLDPALEKQFRTARDEFIVRANNAYRRAAKLHRMDTTLHSLYQEWPTTIRKAAHEAAQIGWVMNIQGFEDDRSPQGGTNRNLLSREGALFENLDGLPTVGGVAYANERAGDKGLYGKSAVEVTCGVDALSGTLGFSSLIGGTSATHPIRVNAGAQPIAAMIGATAIKEGERYVFQRNTALGKIPLVPPAMQWNRPTLFSIVGSEAGPLH